MKKDAKIITDGKGPIYGTYHVSKDWFNVPIRLKSKLTTKKLKSWETN